MLRHRSLEWLNTQGRLHGVEQESASANYRRSPREHRRLDEAARAAAPGEFVTLAEGKTHYKLAQAPPGMHRSTVILIHGFSVPSFIWNPTFDSLAEAGFAVLSYDLFGRGYSDRPAVRYDLDLFGRQLDALITTLDLAVPIDLVGLSMGGAIAIGFADRHPHKVRRLALLDPAGFAAQLPRIVRVLRVPFLGELLMATVGKRVLVSGLVRDFRAPEMLPELAPQYLAQMQYRGFTRALLSTVRHGPLFGMQDVYQRVGRHDRLVLLIWGREDTVVPFSLSEAVRDALPQAAFHGIEAAGHAPHLERPQLINRLLIDFLAADDK